MTYEKHGFQLNLRYAVWCDILLVESDAHYRVLTAKETQGKITEDLYPVRRQTLHCLSYSSSSIICTLLKILLE
jgi:hypothetical protein